MVQVINNVEFTEGTTVTVTATSNGNTVTFHVQTVEGEYRPSLGCWIFTNDDGEDLNQDNYPDFDFSEIVNKAEELWKIKLQNLPADEGRLAYQKRKNSDTNPYTEDDWRHHEWWLGWSTAEECDQDDLYDWST